MKLKFLVQKINWSIIKLKFKKINKKIFLRSNSPRNRINIFLDDSRKLHEIDCRKKDLQKKSRRLNKDFSKNASKNTKKVKMEYKGINEALMKLLESCDEILLDRKDEGNRSHRKKIIKDINQLMDRNDKAISFL